MYRRHSSLKKKKVLLLLLDRFPEKPPATDFSPKMFRPVPVSRMVQL